MLPSIEILDINDKSEQPTEPTGPINPKEELVVEAVQQFFRYDPLNQYLGTTKLLAVIKDSHPNWSLSEKRLKAIMKNNNLSTQLQQAQYLDQIEYASSSKSLPKKLFSKFNEVKGYSLHVSTSFKKGEVVFVEPKPILFIPQLDHLNLSRASKACTYCGALLPPLDQVSKRESFLNHLDCNHCTAIWCSPECKKEDRLHPLLNHSASKSNHLISSKAFEKYATFCFENGTHQDLYAVAIIKAHFRLDESLREDFFSHFAKVSESVRYSVRHPNADIASDDLYKEAFQLFKDIFINDEADWEEFLLMLGIYNLNNFEGSLFNIQHLINHECEGNVTLEINKDNVRNGIKAIANREIAANDEITFSYVNPHFDLNNRLKQLRLNYGFVCHCRKCQTDDQDLQRRKSSNAQHLNSLQEFKELIKNGRLNDFDLHVPANANGCGETERRKSVRFNEKVVAVNEN